MKLIKIFSILLILSVATPALSSRQPANHRITVTVSSGKSLIEVRDTLTLHPDTAKDSITLHLHADYQLLNPDVLEKKTPGLQTIHKKTLSTVDGVPVRQIDISKSKNIPWPTELTLKFHYSGPVHGMVEETGVQLSGADYFYPQVVDEKPQLVTFTLTAITPHDWTAVSQGHMQDAGAQLPVPNAPRTRPGTSRSSPRRLTTLPKKPALDSLQPGAGTAEVKQSTIKHLLGKPKSSDSRTDPKSPLNTITWVSNEPQEEIILIADRFEKYESAHGAVQLYAFLRSGDEGLANQYLKAAGSYIDFYEKLLAPYPYTKFALVENARQTGYGMPSFTLLGSQVIRLPFILHTSYPHEILHNWWGNSVYIHPDSGNWSEGLTSYLSDHLLAEIEGQGEKYRFQELMKYLNYVAKDFPLSEFKSRSDMASQAIGYGKWLMVLNMLRVELGDDVFLRSLREFYRVNKFRFAGYGELRTAFESVSGKNLEHFFQQWIMRAGAPELELSEADYAGEHHTLHIKIRQKQTTSPFRLTLPIAVWFKNSELPQLSTLKMEEREQAFDLDFPNEPVAVMLDPYYDVFRKLDRRETPPSIGQTYGSDKVITLLDEKDPVDYRPFAQSLTGQEEGNSRGQGDIPPGHGVWVFGKNNDMAGEVIAQLKQYGVEIDSTGVTVEGKPYPWENHSFVFTVRNPQDPASSMTWVVTNDGVPGLIRKLPHYGKFGYMVFEGIEPSNILKGAWPAERVGMTKTFHQDKLSLPQKSPLVDFKPVQ